MLSSGEALAELTIKTTTRMAETLPAETCRIFKIVPALAVNG
jgi:hypothetical protein